jgi:hypothetical protein
MPQRMHHSSSCATASVHQPQDAFDAQNYLINVSLDMFCDATYDYFYFLTCKTNLFVNDFCRQLAQFSLASTHTARMISGASPDGRVAR